MIECKCQVCGKRFMSVGRKKYCSDCMYEKTQRYQKKWRQIYRGQGLGAKPKNCVDCGKEFTPSKNDERIKRCPACQQKRELEYSRKQREKGYHKEYQKKLYASQKPVIHEQMRPANIGQHIKDAEKHDMSYALYMTHKKLGWIKD